jgi:hypothetical protein
MPAPALPRRDHAVDQDEDSMKPFLKAGVSFLAVAAAMGGVLGAAPAQAQDAASIRSIQQQIQQLEQQLKKLQVESVRRDADLKKAQEDATQARAEAAEAQKQALKPAQAPFAKAGTAVVTIPNYDPNKPNGKFSLGGVTVTLGGFVGLDGIYRSRNETRGPSSSFNNVPFRNSPDGNLSELRFSAQETRISLLVEGNVDAADALAAYGEADFINGAGTANSVQSNSYTPRLRQAYMTWDNSDYGVHLLGGQSWSLATPFKVGLTPRSEWQPMTIDHSYLPGYAFLRVPEIRITKDIDTPIGKTWFGIAADDPQTVFGGNAINPRGVTTLVTGSGAGITSTGGNPAGTVAPLSGNGGLNPTQNYSYSVAPDVIVKAATDTKIGHFEVFGVARWFKDRVEFAGAPAGRGNTNVTMGGGVGATAYVSLIKPYLDLSANFLYGSGMGRYGAAGLPDVTYKADGSLTPLREVMGTVGLVGHPIPTVDIYGYYGRDQVEKKSFTAGAAQGGYGFSGNNTGCDVELSLANLCQGNNRSISEITGGFWWRFYKGPYGTAQTGVQYGHVERKLFSGTGGAPTARDDMVFAALRYYPFN